MVEQRQRQLPARPGACGAGWSPHGSPLYVRPDHEGRPSDRRCRRPPRAAGEIACSLSRSRSQRPETKLMAAGYGWERAASLREWLLNEPYRFELYQAVRLLEVFAPRALVSGGTEGAEQGAVRFRSRVSLSFPASEVHDLEWTATVPRLTVNFLGLGGALGPLPAPYTEMILEAQA